MKCFDPRFAAIFLCASAALAGAAGCSSAPPRVTPEQLAASLAGLQGSITFSEVGGPVDVPATATADLTLPSAIERAVRSDPQIQASIARVRAAQAAAKQERLLPNPVLSLVVRFPEGGGSPTIEAGLAADLISLLSKPGRIGVADSRLRAAAADVETTVLDVIAAVQERYVAVQASGELLAVIEERASILDRLMGITRSRLEAGEGTRLDLISLEAQRLELLTERADAQLQEREDRLTLARLMGQPSSLADWRLTRWEPRREPTVPESRWVALGLENRPEVRQQRFELAALGQEVRLTGFAPFDGGDAGADAQRDGGEWSVGPGASVPLPIFDWGQEKREGARAAVVEARHKLTGLRRQIVEETRRAFATFEASSQNLERVRTELLPLSQRRLEQAEAQFRGGQTDITALLQAEEQARAARTRMVQLERRNAESLIRLQRAVGGNAVMTSAVEARSAGATSAPAASMPITNTHAVNGTPTKKD